LTDLPVQLASILKEINGLILYNGALHVRGAASQPKWHSLRDAWHGEQSFQSLYDAVRSADIPFAQDQFGDQFLIRDGKVVRLLAETGKIEPLATDLDSFWSHVYADIVRFLNVGIDRPIEPGQLIGAYPPFCFKKSGAGAALFPVPAEEVILFHADLAKRLRDVPVGTRLVAKVTPPTA